MKKLEKTLVINREQCEKIQGWMSQERKSREEAFQAHDRFAVSVDFGGGVSMCIKLNGVLYDPESANVPLAQAVLLFNGIQVAEEGPSECFFGVWNMQYNGKAYIATIVREDVVRKTAASLVDDLLEAAEKLSNAKGALISYLNSVDMLDDGTFDVIDAISDGEYDDVDSAVDDLLLNPDEDEKN